MGASIYGLSACGREVAPNQVGCHLPVFSEIEAMPTGIMAAAIWFRGLDRTCEEQQRPMKGDGESAGGARGRFWVCRGMWGARERGGEGIVQGFQSSRRQGSIASRKRLNQLVLL